MKRFSVKSILVMVMVFSFFISGCGAVYNHQLRRDAKDLQDRQAEVLAEDIQDALGDCPKSPKPKWFNFQKDRKVIGKARFFFLLLDGSKGEINPQAEKVKIPFDAVKLFFWMELSEALPVIARPKLNGEEIPEIKTEKAVSVFTFAVRREGEWKSFLMRFFSPVEGLEDTQFATRKINFVESL